MHIHILCFPTGPYATNMYIVYSKELADGVIIDPGVDSYPIVCRVIREYSLEFSAVWLTHSHWDHIAGAARVKTALSLPIYIHAEDRNNLEDPGSDGVPMPDVEFPGIVPDRLIQEGELLQAGPNTFQVIHTPGHTPGSVCFYCASEKILFSGDTLFCNGIGRLDLPTGQPQKMGQSLAKIGQLPADTVVYPGHGTCVTIQAAKLRGLFV